MVSFDPRMKYKGYTSQRAINTSLCKKKIGGSVETELRGAAEIGKRTFAGRRVAEGSVGEEAPELAEAHPPQIASHSVTYIGIRWQMLSPGFTCVP